MSDWHQVAWSRTIADARARRDDRSPMAELARTEMSKEINLSKTDIHIGQHKEGCAACDELRESLRRADCFPALLAAATEVMALLERYGPSIVPHLMDSDDNPGESLRAAIREAKHDD